VNSFVGKKCSVKNSQLTLRIESFVRISYLHGQSINCCCVVIISINWGLFFLRLRRWAHFGLDEANDCSAGVTLRSFS
jgi:hypothetical protein